MRRKLFFLLLFLLFVISFQTLRAQISFIKSYGYTEDEGVGYSAKQTLDGGYIFCASAFGILLIKTDAYGDTLWSKTYTEDTVDIIPSDVEQTSDKGYIIAGQIGNKDQEIIVIKTDSSGNLLWNKTYGLGDAATIREVKRGGYIISGSNENNPFVNSYALLVRINNEGDTTWTRNFWTGLGGSYFNAANQTIDGGFIAAGGTDMGGLSGDSNYYNIYAVKTDSNGIMEWSKGYGGYYQPNSLGSGASDVKQTSDSGYIIIGVTNEFGTGQENVYLIKTDAGGDTTWTRTYGGNFDDYGVGVLETNTGDYVIDGSNYRPYTDIGNAFLIKVNESGDTIWTRNYYGGANQYECGFLEATSDNGYLLSGTVFYYAVTNPDTRGLLIKTDSLGYAGCNNNLPTYKPVYNFTVGYPHTIVRNAATMYSPGINDTMISSNAILENTVRPIINSCPYDSTEISGIKAVSKLFQDSVSVYPNPAGENCIVQFPMSVTKGNELELFNIDGVKQFSYPITFLSSFNLNTADLPNGVYIIRIEGDNNINTQKLVVIH